MWGLGLRCGPQPPCHGRLLAVVVWEQPSLLTAPRAVNPARGSPAFLRAPFISVQFPEFLFQIIFHLLLQALGTHVVST